MGGFNVDPERLARARARIAASRSTPAQGFTDSPQNREDPEEEQSGFRRAISGFGSALEAIDRPLTERLGIRVPEMSGPLDEIVNFALQEASRPTNLAVAFGGAGAAARLGASSSRAARGLGAVIQPISRSASLPARVAAEGIVSGAGRLGAEAASTLVPEDAGPIATTISALVGGLGGAAGAAGVLRGLSRAGTREIPELTKIVNTSGNVVIAPPKLAQQVFGAQPIEVGTTDLEHLTNRIARGITRTAEIDDVGAPLIREQEHITRVANNIGIAESQRVGAKLFTAFEFEPNRVVVNVNGRRTTIADIAARYPEWEEMLTPAQREAMETLQASLAPYKGVLQEVGAEVGTRPDVMEGGFYVSRGNALEEGADLPKNFGRPGKGGKITSQQEAKFVSQIDGIEKGWEYTPVENTIHSYIADVGKKTADLMTVNYLKTLTNADGERIVKAAKDLMPPYMRAKARNLKSKIRNARDRSIRETAAERVARKQATGSAKRVGAVSGELERARVKFEAQQAKLDEMILRGEIEPDLTLKAREDFVSARKALREIQAQEVLLKSAEDDLRAIEAQYNKFDDVLKSDASAAEKAAAKKAKAALKYDELRDEWRDFAGEYKAAKAKSQQVPPGYARINMRGLEQYSFPTEIANFMNDHLAKQGPNIGKNKVWADVLENFNNIYRSFRATLDLSGAGIQTLLGGYRRPNEWRKSIGLMARTLGDERALGKFLNDFDAAAAIPSRTLAQRGLHFSSSADEFILGGTDLQRKLMALPGIKQSNRAFGGVGDAMRTMWVDAEVKSLLAKGRPLDDIIENGDLDKIINAVNKMTGHSNTRAGGSLGDMVLFAPRFLQARLDTVAMGAKGLLPGAAVDERLAAKSLAQMIGLGVLATAAINEFFGDEDIDWLSPVNDDGSYNSNFMRARIAGNDISMFGPWDSLLRAMMLTAGGNPQDAVRSMASGTVSMGWDLISGETSIGEPTRDTTEQLLTTLATSTLPFASGDMFGNAQRIAGGDVGGGGLAALTDVIGVKASEMTPFERLDNAARAIHGRPWVELTGTEKAEVEQKHPELVEQYGKRVQQNAERGVTTSILTVERGKIDTKRWDTEAQLMDALSNNLISPSDFSEAIDRLQRESSIMKRTLEEFLGVEFDQTIPENRALSAYYDTYTEAEIAGGIIDWDERDRLEEALFADIAAGKYGDPKRAREMIDERRRPTHNPAIQWYYDNKKIISDSNYYGVREEEFSKMADIIGRMAGEPIETYIGIERAIARATSEGNSGLAARLKLLKSRIDQNVSRQRERKRLLDPELDAALVQNKGLTPIRQRRR